MIDEAGSVFRSDAFPLEQEPANSHEGPDSMHRGLCRPYASAATLQPYIHGSTKVATQKWAQLCLQNRLSPLL